MMTEDQLLQVRKLLRSGVPEGEIKQDLVNKGFSDEEIRKVFAPGKYDMRSWYLIFAVIFLLAGIWLLLTRMNVLLLVFSAVMFYIYHEEVKKYK